MVLLLAGAGCALVLALSGRGGSSGETYTLMQMNLCLSGVAGCYGTVAYPAVVERLYVTLNLMFDRLAMLEQLGLSGE